MAQPLPTQTQQQQPLMGFQQPIPVMGYPAAPSQFQTPKQIYQSADQDAKLHISDLHESFTEEVLWNQFKRFGTITSVKLFRDREKKSKGFAKISFQNPENAKTAMNTMNLELLLPGINDNQQKIIKVCKDLNKESLDELKKNNIYFQGIPKDIQNYKEIYNFFTQFGEIQSLDITNASKKRKEEGEHNSGFGYVLFREKKVNEEVLAKSKVQFKDSEITFEAYKPRTQRSTNSATPNTIYINEFTDAIVPEDATQEAQDKTIAESKSVLEKALASYGKVESIFVQIDKKSQKPFAFCQFEDASNAQRVYQDFKIESSPFRQNLTNSLVYVNYKESKNNNTILPDGQFLHVKNLKPYNTEEEKVAFQETCQKVFGKFGKIRRIEISKGVKPVVSAESKKVFPDACFAQILYSSQQEGYNCIMNYISDSETRDLFLGNNPHGNITIHLPKSERKRMVNNTTKYQKNLQTAQQMNMMAQQQQAMQQPMYQQQYPRQNNNFQNRGQFPNRNNNNMNFQQGQNNFNRGGQRQQNQPQNRGQPRQSQPKPLSQEQQQPKQGAQDLSSEVPLNLESLKQNLAKFTNLESTKQSQILGNLIYPKVLAIVKAADKPDSLAPKITGMLIDFQVFDVSDIIDILESEEELKERVNEAIELIQQQQ